jgi:hypothetical protein
MKNYGAVLAVNVKDVDFLMMDKASKTSNTTIVKEWESIDESAHGIDNFTVYYPANTSIDTCQGVNSSICQKCRITA